MRSLDHLSETDWDGLEHAYGSAGDIPDLLRDVHTGVESFGDLLGALCHQGTRYSASAAAVPYVAGLTTADDPDVALYSLMLLGCLAIGDDDGYSFPRAAESHGIGDRHALDAYRAVSREIPALTQHIGHSNERVSLAATWLVSWFPDLASQTLDLVRAGPPGATTTLARGLLGDSTVQPGGWPEAVAAICAGDTSWSVDAVLAEARTRRDLVDPTTPYVDGDVGGILAAALTLVPAALVPQAVSAARMLADRARARRDTPGLTRVQSAIERLRAR